MKMRHGVIIILGGLLFVSANATSNAERSKEVVREKVKSDYIPRPGEMVFDDERMAEVKRVTVKRKWNRKWTPLRNRLKRFRARCNK